MLCLCSGGFANSPGLPAPCYTAEQGSEMDGTGSLRQDCIKLHGQQLTLLRNECVSGSSCVLPNCGFGSLLEEAESQK